MSTLDITIGGREFPISCGPGDEPRVRALAEAIDGHYQPRSPRFSQNLLFACLLAADEVFDKAGVAPGKDPELARLRERLDEVERERDRLGAALSSATDARGRLERDLREAREQAAGRNDAEAKAQAERIATLEKRCADLQHKLEDAQMQELPLGGVLSQSSEEELLPALERFADLLESCADKLEAGAPST